MARVVVLSAMAICLCAVPLLGATPGWAVAVEAAAGTACGYAAGYAGAVTLSSVFAAGQTGWESLSRRILGAVAGFCAGTVAGSSLGVIGAGTLLGIEGDVGLCVLASAAGTGAVLGVSIAFATTDRIFPFAPVIAALAGALGFNSTADSQ
jgi:hypothetical protein